MMVLVEKVDGFLPRVVAHSQFLAVMALVVSAAALFIPLAGALITLPSALFLAVAAGAGRSYALTAAGVNLANLLLFSPLLKSSAMGGVSRGDWEPMVIYLGLILIQLLALASLLLLKRRLSGLGLLN
uniref:Uncharacterized protein n=1 Tax=Magnetococcus massalia (strain MO-1) TaxID=451514 RepID=A0A1S7LGB6_MAGMO|nr:Membrane protein of unknown function [Candidatus Magnetococcus massalia]